MGTLIALQKDIIWCSQPATPPEPETPDGKTVTPINDAEIWLACAGLTETGYTTLSEILEDSSILLAAIAADNAIDYLVRSTDFATDICANQNAIMAIDSSQYASTTLFSDLTWHDALIASPYLSQDFAYTGTIKPFNVSASGIYKLEVWGAQGGYSGGYGGYSYGNVALEAGDTIYICVGGTTSSRSGGYNGGGPGGYKDSTNNPFGGGGATHIGKTNALLKNTAKADVYIVAGGGGGYFYNEGHSYGGGTGGGTSGGAGTYGAGGTQTGGAAYGAGGDASSVAYSSGGGAGLYGGYANNGGGGGGSGYIGGCISGTAATSNGVRSGHGVAKITFVEFS